MKYWSVKNNQPQETIDFRALGLTEWEYRVLLNLRLYTKNAIEEYSLPTL